MTDVSAESPAWPLDLRGVTESIVTTRGPNDRWNVAALGLIAGEPVTARTWGRTRTWRNFDEHGDGYVQFSRDPVVFVDAALRVREADEPVLDSADAWVRVSVTELDSGTEDGTRWVDWSLVPKEVTVQRRVVPATNRGYAAVVEATVAASRLEVPGYDTAVLENRLEYFEGVVDRCGGERERDAFDRLRESLER